MTDFYDSFFFPHTVRIRDRSTSALGSTYSDPRDSIAEVIDEQQLVRNADGQEVVSSTRVTVPLAAAVDVGARVTVWLGGGGEREATVLSVARDVNDPPLPSHLVLNLT